MLSISFLIVMNFNYFYLDLTFFSFSLFLPFYAELPATVAKYKAPNKNNCTFIMTQKVVQCLTLRKSPKDHSHAKKHENRHGR